MRFLFTLICLLPSFLNASTYYVATNGSNANPGSSGSPWLTIGKGLSNAVAGDTVVVRAGVYNEFLTNSVSGTAGNPITFQGERGASGEWLTIIDPSTSISTGWVTAPEIGSGVWKKTDVPFTTHELTIANKRVGYVFSIGDMSTVIGFSYDSSGWTTGAELLSVPSNQTVIFHQSHLSGSYWDGLEALWSATNNITYLRLRDGSDPNGLSIRAAPNSGTLANATPDYAAIKTTSASYITYKDFLVRGSVACFYIYNSHHWTIQDNYLANGIYRVYLTIFSHDCTVTNNVMTTDFYASVSGGAWGGNNNATARANENRYILSKELMGDTTTLDCNVLMTFCGQSNVISGNTLMPGIGLGIGLWGYTTSGIGPSTGTIISGNSISGQPDTGVLLSYGQTETQVYDNLIANCNSNMRCHEMDAAETNRTIYIYRNRFYQPPGNGTHTFFFFNSGSGTASFFPTFWFYHNSFSGGYYGVQPGNNRELSNVRWVNNIWSSHYQNLFLGSGPLKTNATYVGGWDYSIAANAHPDASDPAWWGSSNIAESAAIWETNSVPDFILSSGSSAIDSALDTTASFTLKGTNYSALPQNSASKVGSAWDIGALEYTPPPSTPVTGKRQRGPKLNKLGGW